MGLKICGIDLGAHSVKATVFQSAFRKFKLVAFREILLPEIDKSEAGQPFGALPEELLATLGDKGIAPLDPSLEGESRTDDESENIVDRKLHNDFVTPAHKTAISELLASRTFKADLVITALPGTAVIVRYLSFPFADPRKIAPVVGYEIEGQLPFELDEIAFDHMILEAGSPSRAINTRVLAAASPLEVVSSFLSELESVGASPQIATIAPLAYGFLGDNSDNELTAVLDIGHRQTNLCILRKKHPVFLRTLSRGGNHVTAAISKTLDINEAQAEHVKQTEGIIPRSGEVLDSRREALGETIKKSLRPWDLGLRQSITAAGTELGATPSSVVLCGGGSQLNGMEHHVAEITGLPQTSVRRVGVQDLNGQGPEAALSYGLCHLAHIHRRDVLNLRKGELAPSSSMSLLREKAFVFIVALVTALGLLTLNGWAKLSRLRKEEKVLSDQLFRETHAILGQPMTNEEQVLQTIQRLRRGARGTTLPIPNSSAYAILSEVSRRAPPSEDVTLDVRTFNIRPRKITISGTAGSASEVEKFVNSLKEIDCFKTVSPGTTTEVGKEDERRSEFSINIESECM